MDSRGAAAVLAEKRAQGGGLYVAEADVREVADGRLGMADLCVTALLGLSKSSRACQLLLFARVDSLLLSNPLFDRMEGVLRSRGGRNALGLVRPHPKKAEIHRVDPAVLDPQWDGTGWGLGPAVFRGYDDIGRASGAHLLWCRCLDLVHTLVRRLDRSFEIVAQHARAAIRARARARVRARASKHRASRRRRDAVDTGNKHSRSASPSPDSVRQGDFGT